MRRSKEIIVLLALLVGAMGFVLWYVIDRRTQNRATPAPVTRTMAPEPPPASPAKPEVDLVPNKTLDFSSGQPVVTDSAADRAAIDEAMKDIAAASKDVTFEPTPKPKAGAPAQPAKRP